MTARSNAGGPGSEYSLPPSYRAQHQINNSRPSPQTISSGANGASDAAGSDSLNASLDLPNHLSTDSVIAVPQQQQMHQQQQTQNQQRHQRQQNSITSDASPDGIKHNVLVDVVNNTKISQISSNENSSLATTNIVDRSHRKSNGTKDGIGSNGKSENSARKDLVTIVTISGVPYSDNDASGEMDILAHL